MTDMPYPRNLSTKEKEILLWLLPEHIPAYKPYNNFLQNSEIIGEGRWGDGDLIFDKTNSTIDRTLGMPPVIAYGECTINNSPVSISAHDFNIDDQFEAQFSGIFPIPESSVIENKWCYSYWKPGEKCPATSTEVKEISIKDIQGNSKYVLAISPKKKVLWLHHVITGFNQLIPITSFYDELLRIRHIRDANLIAHPATFFERINNFDDNDYIKAILEYNKKASRKFDPSNIALQVVKKKKNIFQRLFGK